MTRLTNRISKLERNVSSTQSNELLTLTLNYIEKHGYEAFYKDCCNNDYNVALEHLFTSLDDVFDVEHYRGKIPDGIVQKMYSKCQNYAYSAEKKAIIRERMG